MGQKLLNKISKFPAMSKKMRNEYVQIFTSEEHLKKSRLRRHFSHNMVHDWNPYEIVYTWRALLFFIIKNLLFLPDHKNFVMQFLGLFLFQRFDEWSERVWQARGLGTDSANFGRRSWNLSKKLTSFRKYFDIS